MRLLFPLALLTLSACKEPIVAPAELGELCHYLFVSWPDEDPAVMTAGLDSFQTWATTEANPSSDDLEERFYLLPALARADVEALVNHDLDPSGADGVGVVYASRHTPADHASLFGLADQRPLEPASPDRYDRTITDGDAACFASGDCETLQASNDINRRNALFSVDYILMKAWRWVTLTDGSRAIAARTWTPDAGEPQEGSEDVVHQAYSIELWIPSGEGSIRWLVTWQDAELGLEEDTLQSLVGSSMQDAYEAVDEYLDANPAR